MTDDAREQREYEQQLLIRATVHDLHRAYAGNHLHGFAAAASVILDALRMSPTPRPEPPIIGMLHRVRAFARSEAELTYLLGRLLTQLAHSVSIEVGRQYLSETLRGER